MAFVIDPETGALIPENQSENKSDINKNLYSTSFDETNIDFEDPSEIGGATAFAAGVGSGLIKTVEGVVSLGAELIDLGADTNTAAKVETFFDSLNPFEEIAEQRAVGRLTEALVQIGIPGAAGAKLATVLASKAIRAKKAGKYVNFKSANFQKGIKKTKDLNKLSGKQRFAAIVAGGAAGETLVADVENIGTFGDLFQGGPTELDRDVRSDPSDDAARKSSYGSNSDGLIDYMSEYNFAWATYAAKRDIDCAGTCTSDNDFTGTIMGAYLEGRALIHNQGSLCCGSQMKNEAFDNRT